MNYYERMIFNFARRYQQKKRYPAAVICARLNNEVNIDKSGGVPRPMAIQLENSLSALGEIGTRNNGGNFIGRCAEVRASNPLLINHPGNRTGQINFTSAYRPRTMQIIPTCHNCEETF